MFVKKFLKVASVAALAIGFVSSASTAATSFLFTGEVTNTPERYTLYLGSDFSINGSFDETQVTEDGEYLFSDVNLQLSFAFNPDSVAGREIGGGSFTQAEITRGLGLTGTADALVLGTGAQSVIFKDGQIDGFKFNGSVRNAPLQTDGRRASLANRPLFGFGDSIYFFASGFATNLLEPGFGLIVQSTVNFNNLLADDSVPGVPEPATWLMMITGFGFVAVAARRTRKRMLQAV